MSTIILAGNSGYAEPTGSWGGTFGVGGERYVNAGPASATFTFSGLTVGVAYVIAFSWTQNANRVTNTAWSVSGTSGSPSGTIDQQAAASVADVVSNAANYQYFAQTFTPTGTTLTLTIAYPASPSPAGNYTVIDGGALVDVAATIVLPTAQPGDWNTGATWRFGSVPTVGRAVQVSHAITVVADTTVGDGTASTVLNTGPGASITVTGCTLTIRGNATIGGVYGYGTTSLPYLILASTTGHPAALVLDGNAGVTPTVSFNYNAIWKIVGTAADRVSVRTKSLARGDGADSAGDNGIFNQVGGAAGTWFADFQYADFYKLGGPATSGMTATPDAATPPAPYTAPPFLVDYCTFDHCGQYTPQITITGGAPAVRFRYCRWTGSTASFYCFLWDCPDTLTTGTRAMQHCTFDASCKPFFIIPDGCSIDHNTFLNGLQVNGSQGVWASFTDNFVQRHVTEEQANGGDVDSCYSLVAPVPDTGAIFHFIIPHNTDTTFSNVAYEYIGTGDQAWFLGMSESATRSRNAIAHHCVGNGPIGNSFNNPNDGANQPFFGAHHCTVQVLGPTYGGSMNTTNGVYAGGQTLPAMEAADQFLYLRDSIIWSPSPGSGLYAMTNTGGVSGVGIVVDACRAANIHHNCLFNLNAVPGGQWTTVTPISGATTCTDGTAYNSPMSGATAPGAHDVQGDPQFVAAGSGIVAWDASLGGPGTLAHALLKLVAQYDPTDPDHDARYTTAALIAFRFAAHRPRNAAIATASSVGDTIGAVAYAAPSATYTLAAPSPAKGDLATASGAFTVTPGSSYTGTITPSDGGAGGTFTPASLSWSASSAAKTFTYTPARWGARTIATTSSPTLTDPAPVAYLAMVQLGQTVTGPAVGTSPALGGFDLMSHGPWLPELRRDIRGDAADSQSATIIGTMIGESAPGVPYHLYLDFSGPGGAPTYGMPFNVVPGTQALKPVAYTAYPAASPPDGDHPSDFGPVPIPANPAIENYYNATNPPAVDPTPADGHCLIAVRDETTGAIDTLWELYDAFTADGGANWQAHGGAKFNLATGAPRPDEVSSVDAAGLPILPLVVRYEEVASGDIGHAIRGTFGQSVCGSRYAWPARHQVNQNGLVGLHFGSRIRLTSAWYAAHAADYTGQARVWVDAMRTYGVINADVTGSDHRPHLIATSDSRWDVTGTTSSILLLNAIPATAFEVAYQRPGWTWSGLTSGPVGTPRTITVTRNPPTDVNFGSNIYLFVDGVGGGPGLSASSVAIFDGTPSASFTFTPPSVGSFSITGGDGNNVWIPASAFAFIATPTPATSYTLGTSSTSGTVGVPVILTVSPVRGPYTGTVTVAVSGGGLSATLIFPFSSSSFAQSQSITPTSVGTVTFTPSASPALGTDPISSSYTANASSGGRNKSCKWFPMRRSLR